jgi:hypothetical protein
MTQRAPIMKLWTLIATAMVCLLLAAGHPAVAQDQTSSSSSSAQNGSQSGSKPDVPPETPVRPNTDSYAVSLGTGQVISLSGDQQGAGNATSGETPVSLAEYADGLRVKTAGNDFRNQFFYGSSVSGFYTNGFPGSGYNNVLSSSVSPYMGVLIPTKTGSYMLQYAAVIDPNTEGPNGMQAYHAMTFSAQGALTRRWYWAFNSSASYGSELARAQGSLGYSVVQGTPVVNTSSAATLFPANNVSFIGDTATLTWLESRRDRISFTGLYNYSGIEGLHLTSGDIGNHENLLGTVVGWTHAVNSRFDVRAYGDANTVLNGPVCNSFGGGVGATVRMSHSVVFDGQVGPQRNSASCGGQQNIAFSASLVKGLRNGDRIYASGGRVFTTAYRTNGFWEDNAAVGFAKGIRRVTLVGEAGYLRGEALSSTVASYQGYFVAPRLRLKINNSMGFSAGYRVFNETGGGLPSGNLRFALVSIDWYPAAIHFR